MYQSGPKIYTEEYYEALLAIEGKHWWTLGMDDIMDRLLLPRLGRRKDLRIIDMGCGSGVGLAWARSRFDPARLLGVDISEYGLQRCANRGAELMVGSVTDVPVEANSFDLAICNDVLQHMEDDQKAVNEAYRILAPGGLFFARTNARFILPLNPGCLRLYTTQSLHKLLQVAGFESVIVSPTNALGSLIAVAKHYALPAPKHGHHDDEHESPANEGGILIKPKQARGASLAERLMRKTLSLEGAMMQRMRVPFGHTHIVLARKPG